MRVLKPGQKVTLYADREGLALEGYIRCVTIYDDMSVQYECRWWFDSEPYSDNFSLREIEEGSEAEYIEVGNA
jgi:hypothetical protein